MLAGVGGIGTGMFFALEGEHTLGRNESRPGRLLDVRDYCKLHIIAHYVSVLLGARPSGTPFHVLPIGKVGDDEIGRRLTREMKDAGMDTRFVRAAKGKPTLLSVCFQYPDGSGGNITTSDAAATGLSAADIRRASAPMKKHAGRLIALAAPEVPLLVRRRFLETTTRLKALRAAAFTSAEIHDALEMGIFQLCDIVSINEDEAAMLAGVSFDAARPRPLLDKCAAALTRLNPDMRIVVSAGAHGAFGFENGRWQHRPAVKVKIRNTAGAGDALFSGVLTGLAAGWPLTGKCPEARPFANALDLGVTLASLKCTSPHTIHPGADLAALLAFQHSL
jgi:sugar/nucleoside kinase (ribokinase family)